jgi:predicted DNA-binding transcriptional regulator YafY
MIARECGVTERTIYRDIISISEANIPIYYDHGYKFASDNFLPPLNFDVNEYLTLQSVLESTPLYKTGHSRKIIKSIKSKVDACLSQSVRSQKAFKSTVTSVEIKSTVREDGNEKFYAIVEQGIRDNRIIKLTYDSIQSGVSTREIEPYFMIFIEKAFYFVGYCHLRKELRTFRTDRIKNIELTDKFFKPRKDINPAQYFKDSWGVFSGEPVEVEVILSGIAARVVQSSRHHPNEEMKKLGKDKIRYRVKVSGTEEICRWLMGFGGDVTVIKPLQLKKEINRRAEQILKSNK